MFSNIKIISMDDESFYALFDKVIAHIQAKQVIKEDKWVSGQEAMRILRIKSKTTLQKLRDEGQIRFSHPERRIILYDRDSLNDYLDRHAKERF